MKNSILVCILLSFLYGDEIKYFQSSQGISETHYEGYWVYLKNEIKDINKFIKEKKVNNASKILEEKKDYWISYYEKAFYHKGDKYPYRIEDIHLYFFLENSKIKSKEYIKKFFLCTKDGKISYKKDFDNNVTWRLFYDKQYAELHSYEGQKEIIERSFFENNLIKKGFVYINNKLDICVIYDINESTIYPLSVYNETIQFYDANGTFKSYSIREEFVDENGTSQRRRISITKPKLIYSKDELEYYPSVSFVPIQSFLGYAYDQNFSRTSYK